MKTSGVFFELTKYITSELDLPVDTEDSPGEDGPDGEVTEGGSKCRFKINGKWRYYSPGARVCWRNEVLVCQRHGQWHNSGKRCRLGLLGKIKRLRQTR